MACSPDRTDLADEEWQEIDTDSFSILSLSTEVAEDDEEEEKNKHAEVDRETGQDDQRLAASGGDSPILGHANRSGSFETDITLMPALIPVSTWPAKDEKETIGTRAETKEKGVAIPWGNPPPYPGESPELVPLLEPADRVTATTDSRSSGSQAPIEEPDAAYHDLEVDPQDFYNLATSTAKLVDSVVALTSRVDLKVFERLRDLGTPCVKLQPQLDTLALITRAYARHWTQQRRKQQASHPREEPRGPQIPLDPSLLDWLVRLQTAAESVEQYMQQFLGIEYSTGNDKETSYWTSMLIELAAEMDAFLPIIEADFAEFQTAQLTFQSLRDLDVCQNDRSGPAERRDMATSTSLNTISPPSLSIPLEPLLRTSEHDRAPARPQRSMTTGVNRLRRELYSLKDQLDHTMEELRLLRKHRSSLLTKMASSSSSTISSADRAASSDSHQLLADLSDGYSKLKTLLERLLSNNPSDWLEASIDAAKQDVQTNGNDGTLSQLTYAEFVDISPDAVHLWRMELKEATTDIFLARCSVDSVSWNCDPDGRLPADERNQEVLKSRLQALKTIWDVLFLMFVGDASCQK